MRVVVTGASGFLGWHVRCRLRAHADIEVITLEREDFVDLDAAVEGSDAVLHLAGVNRGRDREVSTGNVALASEVAAAVRNAAAPPAVVYANSIQAGNGTPYGDGKAAASGILRAVADESGSACTDVRLPNLFGEHGRPDYNSFVATFCRDVAAGRAPALAEDKSISLLHAQGAAEVLIGALEECTSETLEPPGEPTSVGEILAMLHGFHGHYQVGDLPPLRTPFETDLFNTYRAAAFPGNAPIALPRHTDERGALVECVRAHGGSGQTFVSTTAPGITRGEHFHLRKVERFVVLQGEAQIRLRRMFSDEVVRFDVDGRSPVAVDMPTMWAHSITNVGPGELLTLFWTDSIFDPASTDTWPEPVELETRSLAAVS